MYWAGGQLKWRIIAAATPGMLDVSHAAKENNTEI
jgi:hypothetical protein